MTVKDIDNHGLGLLYLMVVFSYLLEKGEIIFYVESAIYLKCFISIHLILSWTQLAISLSSPVGGLVCPSGPQQPNLQFYVSSQSDFILFCRQKMAEILIHDLHNLAGEAIKTMTNSRSYQILAERLVKEILGLILVSFSIS